ncbi:MAG: glycosyltransferase family 2 protein [Acidobacteriia bacterium]|nr:glycosyltransferase family 2 protein [Terriglobia bacterium]
MDWPLWLNSPVTLSVVIITQNEEENLPRTLQSVAGLLRDLGGEIIIVDSGSTDRTLEIAAAAGARIYREPWKGFAGQKNSALDKATSDWVLSLDADEPLEAAAADEIRTLLERDPQVNAYWISRKNFFLGRWIQRGGFYPDRKLRLIRRGAGQWVEHGAHPTIRVTGPTANLRHAMLHYAYPTLRGYIAHMNNYSSMQAEHINAERPHGFDVVNIIVNPLATFVYNYVVRCGFLDGREGLLLHLYHSAYVSWKYAKAWELSRRKGV